LLLLAAQVRPRVAAEAWVLTMATGAVLSTTTDRAHAGDLLLLGVISAALMSLVSALRSRTEARRALAQQEHLTESEREHRALLEERNRIARELHDVVAHHMSVIAIQAEAAPYKTADPPKELVESFTEIRASALSGLNELRRVLGVLRSDRPDAAPQLGLDDLP